MAVKVLPQGGNTANSIKVKIMNTHPQAKVTIAPPRRLNKLGVFISVLVDFAKTLRRNLKRIFKLAS